MNSVQFFNDHHNDEYVPRFFKKYQRSDEPQNFEQINEENSHYYILKKYGNVFDNVIANTNKTNNINIWGRNIFNHQNIGAKSFERRNPTNIISLCNTAMFPQNKEFYPEKCNSQKMPIGIEEIDTAGFLNLNLYFDFDFFDCTQNNNDKQNDTIFTYYNYPHFVQINKKNNEMTIISQKSREIITAPKNTYVFAYDNIIIITTQKFIDIPQIYFEAKNNNNLTVIYDISKSKIIKKFDFSCVFYENINRNMLLSNGDIYNLSSNKIIANIAFLCVFPHCKENDVAYVIMNSDYLYCEIGMINLPPEKYQKRLFKYCY